MEVTLQDLLHAINILGEDRDVLVDGKEEIAVCPPVKLTKIGREHFRMALTANVVVDYKDYEHRGTYVSDDDDKITRWAWQLLNSLAGYCDSEAFDAWFEGDDAELI